MSALAGADGQRRRSQAEKQPPRSVRVARRYAASPARVFDAWLDPAVARQWLFATASHPLAHVEIDARVEGSFCFVDRQDALWIGTDATSNTPPAGVWKLSTGEIAPVQQNDGLNNAKSRTVWGCNRPDGNGRSSVRRILASYSRSHHWFSAEAPHATNAVASKA